MTEKRDMQAELLFAPPPPLLTNAGMAYFDSYRELRDFIVFVGGLAISADEGRLILAKALVESEKDDKKRERLQEEIEEDSDRTVRQLREYGAVISESALTRGVDNFLTFVTELLAEVFRARPETLRSSEQVDVEFVLEHDSMESLIENLAERRVQRLAYSGVRDLDKYTRERLNFGLFHEDQLLTAIRIIEGRNLITHNRAVVNRVYLSRVRDSTLRVGDRLVLGDEMYDDLIFLAQASADIDARAAAKWGIEQHKLTGPGDNEEVTDSDGSGGTEPDSAKVSPD